MKKFKPTSPGVRSRSVVSFDDLTKAPTQKSLLVPLKKASGRNNQGKLTVRHRGGRVKRKYRLIDFKRDKKNIPGRVVSIEYDPNRTSRIAMLNYKDGDKRYILAPVGLKVNDVVEAGDNVEIKVGNCLPLRYIPVGTFIHNIELKKNKGGQLVRSAGASAQLMGKDKEYAIIKLTSGKQRPILLDYCATIGQLGNIDHWNVVIGKAGISRKLGKRPTVRGAAMNAADHPHGGGEGKAPVGRSGPMTPWGKPALGLKTSRNKKKKKA